MSVGLQRCPGQRAVGPARRLGRRALRGLRLRGIEPRRRRHQRARGRLRPRPAPGIHLPRERRRRAAWRRDGPSYAPAIAADARAISFASAATNLVGGDTNRVPDVFVRVPSTKRTERVSVSSSERQQNRAVAAPFTQVSDISRDGRYVVFESDATNLVRPDANRRTDVFRRDRRTGRTRLVSVDSLRLPGQQRQLRARRSPPAGRFISFQSFATNLAPGGGPREDIFVRDLSNRTTSVVNVPGPRRPARPRARPAAAAAPVAVEQRHHRRLLVHRSQPRRRRHERDPGRVRAPHAPSPGRFARRGAARAPADGLPGSRRSSRDELRLPGRRRRAVPVPARGRRVFPPARPAGRHLVKARAGGPGNALRPRSGAHAGPRHASRLSDLAGARFAARRAR